MYNRLVMSVMRTIYRVLYLFYAIIISYPTKCAIFSESRAVVEEGSNSKRHAEEHDSDVDDSEVEDEDVVMTAGTPRPQDRRHREDVCDHGCDHESDVHGRFDDPCDFFMWRISRGARRGSTVGAIRNEFHFISLQISPLDA